MDFFEWQIPEKSELDEAVESSFSNNSLNDKDRHKIREALKVISHIAMRCGLAHPTFDALTTSAMPFDRPVSVVVDTSAVIHGSLDFVACHLIPQARIKVPAIVHMEILNFVDRYFKQRRFKQNKSSTKTGMLLDHVISQGAHRALIRLETNPKVEIERSSLGSDPLRGIVQPDSDPEDKKLNLQTIARSFADRLILETAIQHRNVVAPDHEVMLLTSDQGLARMALAEGVQPIFSDSNALNDLFGKTLSGVTFLPFLRDATRLSCSSLADVLWEAATSFGKARLVDNKTNAAFTVTALCSDIPWQPYHSREDLLWTKITSPHSTESALSNRSTAKQSPTVSSKHVRPIPPSKQNKKSPGKYQTHTSNRQEHKGSHAFSLKSMLNLLLALREQGELSDEGAMSCIRVSSERTYGEYYNFLVAADLVERNQTSIIKKPLLDELIASIRLPDYRDIDGIFQRVSSYHSFVSKLQQGTALPQEDSGLYENAFRTYSMLSELSCTGIRIYKEGIYGTPNNPMPRQFVSLALDAFDAVRNGERFALTGTWLEHLAKNEGIHPIYVRQRLAEAHQAGYIHRYFEGSTPETRFEHRSIVCLDIDQGNPSIKTANLYYGDFLMAGRASVSINLSIGTNS